MLNWSVIAKNNSLYNTLPIFSIWIAGEVMQGLLSTYGSSGLAGQEAVSNAKAETLYRILDAYPDIYQPVNDQSVRSRMNICFRVQDPATEEEFLAGAEKRLLQGLKGRTYSPTHIFVISDLYESLQACYRKKSSLTFHFQSSKFPQCLMP